MGIKIDYAEPTVSKNRTDDFEDFSIITGCFAIVFAGGIIGAMLAFAI